MFNPTSRASDAARHDFEKNLPREAIPLAIAIVTDDHATAQALVTACEFMPSFSCRVRVDALRDNPAPLRAAPDEVLIIDAANALDRRIDPACFPGSPCVLILHATGATSEPATSAAHARLLFENLSPAALELAVHSAQQNCRALTLAQRRSEALEVAAIAAREGQRRILEEIGPIAHALEGLLEIVSADAESAGAEPPAQFGLLRNWTRDLVGAVRRHQDAAAAPADMRADLGVIVDDCLALFRSKCTDLGHAVVFSNPPESVMVAANGRRLDGAVRDLLESIIEREARGRLIDVVLWRSMDQARLAIVAGPLARRGAAEEETGLPPAVRPASAADTRFVGALARLRELGAVVETSCANLSGSSLLVSLPAA